VRSIAKVTKAVALGDLSKQIEVDARGEILDLKNTVNGMVVRCVSTIRYAGDLTLIAGMTIRLRALAAEVTRVTLEVGSQGKLGGQAHVPDVEGVWLNLVRNVCVLSSTDAKRTLPNFADLGEPNVLFFDRPSAVHRTRYYCRGSRRFDSED